MRSTVSAFLLLLAFVPNAHARPETALKEKQNCAMCHASTWGGGPRNTYGKSYGAHQNKASPLAASDFYYGDFRIIAYHPTRASQRLNGVALMQASAAANAPILQNDDGSEVRALFAVEFSPLAGTTARDAYLAWQPGWTPGGVPFRFTFGRFHLPFGLLTDEHRAYTRIQSGFTLENYETGIAISGNLHPDFHYDLALVSNLRSGGSLNQGDLNWGKVLNLRWNPSGLPFMLGASGSGQRSLKEAQPYALSLYGGLHVAAATLTFERVDAWNQLANAAPLHPGMSDFFGVTPVSKEYRSTGYFSQLKYALNHRWTLLYRFDFLKPQAEFSDTFARHGLGFETYIPGNVIVNARYEKAVLSNGANSDALAAHNDVLMMIRWWI